MSCCGCNGASGAQAPQQMQGTDDTKGVEDMFKKIMEMMTEDLKSD